MATKEVLWQLNSFSPIWAAEDYYVVYFVYILITHLFVAWFKVSPFISYRSNSRYDC